MQDFVFHPAARAALAVEGTDARFPVRRIYCVGRNYAAHAREMGGDGRSPPFFFAKPTDAAVASGGTVAYPALTDHLHYEMELVVALSGGGADVPVERALDLVFGYAAGVDLTRRDLQDAAKEKRQPWEASKGFDASAPIGLIRPAARAGHPQGRISLSVNGRTRQDARLTDMIWSTPEIIAQVSRLWRLEPGDLIFTGTPEGVGPLVRGDRVEGVIENVGDVAFTIG